MLSQWTSPLTSNLLIGVSSSAASEREWGWGWPRARLGRSFSCQPWPTFPCPAPEVSIKTPELISRNKLGCYRSLRLGLVITFFLRTQQLSRETSVAGQGAPGQGCAGTRGCSWPAPSPFPGELGEAAPPPRHLQMLLQMARAAALHAGEGFKLKPCLCCAFRRLFWLFGWWCFFFYVHTYFPSSLSGAAAHLLAVIIDGEAARRGRGGGDTLGDTGGAGGCPRNSSHRVPHGSAPNQSLFTA